MTATAIRKKLAEYCKTGDIKKVKAIDTMVKDDFNGSVWGVEFYEEGKRREKPFLAGTATTYTMEEARSAP